MNVIYYFLGAFITFIGVIAYQLVSQDGELLLNSTSLIEYGITALIAGVAFFITDYIMNKIHRG